MVLKNQDGTPFRLSSPNLLVVKQQWIDLNDLVFHNFTWQGISIPDKSHKVIRRKMQETIVVPDTSPAPKIVLPTNTDSEDTAETQETIVPDKTMDNAIIAHCLPLLEWKTKQDDLYGDTYKLPVYGEKSTLEAIMVEKADLAISLWTSTTLKSQEGMVDTIQYLKPGSIVFPVKFVNGGKIRDHRWWKIEKITPFEKGVLMVAVITDVQPSFA